MVNLIRRARFQYLFFRIAVFLQNPQVCLENNVIHRILINLPVLPYRYRKIVNTHDILTPGIYLVDGVIPIIQVTGNSVAFIPCLNDCPLVFIAGVITPFPCQIYLKCGVDLII